MLASVRRPLGAIRISRMIGLVFAASIFYFVISGLYTAAANAASLRIGYISSDRHEKLLEALQNRYETVHRGERVELVAIGRAEFERELARWLITGEKADVFLLNDLTVAAVKNMGVLRHLDELRWKDMRLDDTFSSFPIGIQHVFSNERGVIGVPLAANAQLLQYNEEIMAQAGVPPLRDIADEWTWYEMIDIGRMVSGSAPGRHLLDIDLEFVAIYFLSHGPVLSEDGRSVTIFNENNVNILGLAQQAIHADRISLSPLAQRQANQRFQGGQLAVRRVSIESMQPTQIARSSGQWPFDWDVAPWPKSPFTGNRPALGDAVGLVVASGSRALPQVESFLEIAFSREGQIEASQAADVYPARLDAWTEAMQRTHSLPVGPPSNRGAFLTTITDWQHFLFPTNVEAEVEALAAPLVGILEGAVEPESGLRLVNEMANRVLNPSN